MGKSQTWTQGRESSDPQHARHTLQAIDRRSDRLANGRVMPGLAVFGGFVASFVPFVVNRSYLQASWCTKSRKALVAGMT